MKAQDTSGCFSGRACGKPDGPGRHGLRSYLMQGCPRAPDRGDGALSSLRAALRGHWNTRELRRSARLICKTSFHPVQTGGDGHRRFRSARVFVDKCMALHPGQQARCAHGSDGQKYWATDLQYKVLDSACSCGDSAANTDYAGPGLMRGVQRIYAGTNGIMKEIIGGRTVLCRAAPGSLAEQSPAPAPGAFKWIDSVKCGSGRARESGNQSRGWVRMVAKITSIAFSASLDSPQVGALAILLSSCSGSWRQ